ncbi:hypothetical protein [Streptomyces sp. NPDC006285]|uniref:hypothetical protein n=1 Tax=Streptomyces sp. NPDC006285 TaxID=3364742 RepID=UPI0036C98286
MMPDTAHWALTEEIARTVESVPGVAFLKPGLAGRLRSALGRPVPPSQEGRDRVPTAGVRLSRPDGAGGRHVEIHLVALRQARAVDVARATRRSVEAYLVSRFPAETAPVHVTVTVTGQV